MKKKSQATPYDDVFRTLVTDLSPLVIPVLNELFGTNYRGDETILFQPNEHFLLKQDGKEQKRITDSSFKVIGEESRSYLLECQSTPDQSMLVRIFEYAAQIAVEESRTEENRLILEIPNAAILFLRSTKYTPDLMEIELHTPGGEVTFAVPAMKIKNYTIGEIFSKRLYFLIPFYIFNYESRLKEIDADEEKLSEVMAEYASIRRKIEEAQQKGLLTAYAGKTIVEMSEKTMEALTENYYNFRKGVKAVMGGTVLDYEAKRILKEGEARGVAIGEARGVAIGEARGEARGVARGERRAISLIQKLIAAGRFEEIQRVCEDADYKQQVMKEFAII